MTAVTRYAMTIGLRPTHRQRYLELHAAVWPAVEEVMWAEGMRNFSIFLDGDTLIGYYEFVGKDHDAAQSRIAADPASRRWWALTSPCQERRPGTPDGAQWMPLREVWHLPDRAPASAPVDSHVHLFDPAELPYTWVRGTQLDRRFDPQDLAEAYADLGGVVVVQADTAPERAVDEVRWVARQFDDLDCLLGVVAHAEIERGREVGPILDTLLAAGPVVGVRRLLQDEHVGFTRRSTFDDGIAQLTARELPFDLCVRAHQLDETAELVSRHPNQRFVLDHLGKPAVGDPHAYAPWRKSMAALAAHPGVVVKLSGLALEVVEGATLAEATPYLEAALELFGPTRCLYGSDWPVLTLRAQVADWRDLVEAALTTLSAHDRAQVMGGTARRIYRRAWTVEPRPSRDETGRMGDGQSS